MRFLAKWPSVVSVSRDEKNDFEATDDLKENAIADEITDEGFSFLIRRPH